jgi:hypothetical protein
MEVQEHHLHHHREDQALAVQAKVVHMDMEDQECHLHHKEVQAREVHMDMEDQDMAADQEDHMVFN